MCMSKRKLNITLVIIGLMVWGYVSLTLISPYSPEGEKGVQEKPNVQERYAAETPPELRLNYKDPFVESKKKVVHKVEMSKPKIMKKQADRGNLRWPVIRFYGLLRNKENENVFGLIDIQDESFIVNTGQSVGEVKVMGYNEDSLTVSYQDETKVYFKSTTH